jgi:hypothetical protein
MDASLDTNVIIHLYKANLQSVLFNRFEKLKVYEFIRNHEILEDKISEKDIFEAFNLVCSVSELDWSINSKLRYFIKRFWTDPYSEREREWMSKFCNGNGIDAKARIQVLLNYIKTQQIK